MMPRRIFDKYQNGIERNRCASDGQGRCLQRLEQGGQSFEWRRHVLIYHKLDMTPIMLRNPVYDRAKGIGMVLVIFGHLFTYGSVPFAFIFSFHMPLFFIISGMLLNRGV